MAEKSKKFWENIWRQSSGHKKDAKRLQGLRSEVNVKKKTGEDRYYHRKLEKRFLVGYQIESHQVQS